MSFVVRRAPACSFKILAALLLVAVVGEGCGGSSQTADQAVDQYFKNDSKAKRLTLAKFGGRVIVDGQAPSNETRLYVILNDPQHLTKPGTTPPTFANCDADGRFAFTTYAPADGVPVGKYVVTFTQLHRPHGATKGPRGMGRVGGSLLREYVGPDDLKNLYNDPQKNVNDTTFVIDVTQPGRDDFEFNLSVDGKEGVATPGEYAITKIQG